MTEHNLSKEIVDLYEDLRLEIFWLHMRWNLYSQLYGVSDIRRALLHDSANIFFGNIRTVLSQDIIMAIGRLCDPPKSCGNDNASFPQSIALARNISSYAIVAYEATIACFDRFGDPVRGFLDDSNEVKLLCQDRIEPGMTKNTKWTLHFRDTATVKRVRIDRIKLANGTIWTPALGNEIHEEYHDK